MANNQISNKKLKAIVFTDIVDFTKLSAEDEQHALNLIDKQREVVKPIVEKHNGEWLKEIGDGLLFSFDSSLDAVNCSIDIQQNLKDIKDFKIRIGIHQGDIFIKDGDVFGDDVNIASRVESFAPEGGIAISDKISKDISGVKDIKTSFVGYKKLKGVEQETQIKAISSHNLPSHHTLTLPIIGAYISFFMSSALAVIILLFMAIYIFDYSLFIEIVGDDFDLMKLLKPALFSITYLFIGYSSLSYARGVSLHSQKLLTYLTYMFILYPFLSLTKFSNIIEVLSEDSSSFEFIMMLISVLSIPLLPIALYYLLQSFMIRQSKTNRYFLIFINLFIIIFNYFVWIYLS